MKKFFHLPTLVLHGIMLLLVIMTLRHYPDTLLTVALIWHVGYYVYAFRLVTKGHPPLPLFLSHTLGCITQELVLNQPNFLYGSLGSDLAHFFYLTGITVSPFILALLLFMAFALKKDPSE